ncbi:hypothetical protein ACA910_006839 [Epithemia clementina (nom. ined.)]
MEQFQRSFRWTEPQRMATQDQSLGVWLYYPLYMAAYELCSAGAYQQAPNLATLATKHGWDSIMTTIKAQYLFFPMIQLISFQGPNSLRNLYAMVISGGWNIFFCAVVAGRYQSCSWY